VKKRIYGWRVALMFAAALLIGGCGGGDSGNLATTTQNIKEQVCNGSCADTPTNLTTADVQQVLSQAIQEALARNVNATIAVSDRVGNILALFQMGDPANPATIVPAFNIETGLAPNSGLENISVLPATYAAIAKAVTASYLSSEGNAFTTRTANFIVQEHFAPREFNQPGGPLFGVQISQLPCNDFNTRFPGDAMLGPKRSPLGFSADPGGIPLYKDGTPVGGIGVIADGTYSIDINPIDFDNGRPGFPEFNNIDEIIALAGTIGFEAPTDRRGDRITVDGRLLRFTDARRGNIISDPGTAPAFGTYNGVNGLLVDDTAPLVNNNPLAGIRNYFNRDNGILAGTAFGQPASGYEPAANIASASTLFADLDAFVLTDGAGNNRFPPIDGTDAAFVGANALTANEVTSILRNAIAVANRSRAQIRRPLNSQARVTISVVDSAGAIVGIARTRDGPVFGTDVSLQKARTAAFISGPRAATDLLSAPDATLLSDAGVTPYTSSIAEYVTDVRTFFNDPNALTGANAFADRSGGNLSRPFYPDGIRDMPNGPLSKPFRDPVDGWSPFSTGLQLDLVLDQVVAHLATGANPAVCTSFGSGNTPVSNGLQIFPGSVPIYRNGVLIGGVGVSGDGVDQDDMISFLGLNNASLELGNNNGIGDGPIVGNAPKAIRADTLAPQGFGLRYVQCPQNPFIGSDEANPCNGK